MNKSSFLEPIDYLVVGHISCDLSPSGNRIGGSVTYAALTAQSLGLKVGIVSNVGEDVSLEPLHGIPIAGALVANSTTFSNHETNHGRHQILHNIAPSIEYHQIPEAWRTTPIIHLAPIAQEISPKMIGKFPHSFVGLTAQGWLRNWDDQGNISASDWPYDFNLLLHASAVIISIEDISNDLNRARIMSAKSQMLAVTLGEDGALVFCREKERIINAPSSEEIDSVGAGDIFSAAFFIYYYKFGNPWNAAKFANAHASASIRKIGIESATSICSPYSGISNISVLSQSKFRKAV